ncbi:uncharacterized protein [Drosophila takahashii]|uniref:uncharacterized protein isoform X2 n=1 Tax=Drosophila takahashii TaxID=29030 RepID=UPI0038994C0B
MSARHQRGRRGGIKTRGRGPKELERKLHAPLLRQRHHLILDFALAFIFKRRRTQGHAYAGMQDTGILPIVCRTPATSSKSKPVLVLGFHLSIFISSCANGTRFQKDESICGCVKCCLPWWL